MLLFAFDILKLSITCFGSQEILYLFRVISQDTRKKLWGLKDLFSGEILQFASVPFVLSNILDSFITTDVHLSNRELAFLILVVLCVGAKTH